MASPVVVVGADDDEGEGVVPLPPPSAAAADVPAAETARLPLPLLLHATTRREEQAARREESEQKESGKRQSWDGKAFAAAAAEDEDCDGKDEEVAPLAVPLRADPRPTHPARRPASERGASMARTRREKRGRGGELNEEEKESGKNEERDSFSFFDLLLSSSLSRRRPFNRSKNASRFFSLSLRFSSPLVLFPPPA